MNIILFDGHSRNRLLPFTHTRPVADIRCGILTMRERWEHYAPSATSTLTEEYLQELFPLETGNSYLYINAAVFATADMVSQLVALPVGSKLRQDDIIIGIATNAQLASSSDLEIHAKELQAVEYTGDIMCLKNVWDIFSLNDAAVRADFALLTYERTSAPLPADVTITGREQVFLEEGGKIQAGCVINATTGPVYIGKDAEIMEGSLVRGPLALCDHAAIKMGAKIYGATTIGPSCKVGGEINNVVFFANSNKGHDGFLGNAVIGEWCNLGADTNCSNLKNNYDGVKIWDEHNNKSVATGLTFCGLLMGDHSKCGINTMFNTGTVAGVSCNIYGADFPEKFIPSFCWGGSEGMVTYSFDKAMDTANRMMGRRGRSLTEQERKMYRHIFDGTEQQRKLFAHTKD